MTPTFEPKLPQGMCFDANGKFVTDFMRIHKDLFPNIALALIKEAKEITQGDVERARADKTITNGQYDIIVAISRIQRALKTQEVK